MLEARSPPARNSASVGSRKAWETSTRAEAGAAAAGRAEEASQAPPYRRAAARSVATGVCVSFSAQEKFPSVFIRITEWMGWLLFNIELQKWCLKLFFKAF